MKTSAFLALICASSSSMAGGYVDSQIPELWNGPYYGAYFGGGAASADGSYSQVFDETTFASNAGVVIANIVDQTTTTAPSLSGRTNGSVVDLFVGYNYHRPTSEFLLGAQLEGTVFSDIRSYVSSNNAEVVETATNLLNGDVVSKSHATNVVANYNMTSMFSIIGRAGFLVRPNTMVYALAGPTEGRFELSYVNNVDFKNQTQWQLGVSAGGGVEHKFNQNWSVIAEYRYLHFKVESDGKRVNDFNAPNAGDPTLIRAFNLFYNTSQKINVNMNIGKVGLVFRR